MTLPACIRPLRTDRAAYSEPWAQFACLIIAALLLAALPEHALSHGGGTPRITAEELGPYRVYAWTEPEPLRVGQVHVTVGVTEPVTDPALSAQLMEQPVAGASVTVTFRSELDPAQVVAVTGVRQAALNNAYFEADTTLLSDGPWIATIDVIAPDASGQVRFSVDVLPARSINWTLVALGALAVLAALGALSLRGRSQAGRTQPVAPQRTGTKKASI